MSSEEIEDHEYVPAIYRRRMKLAVNSSGSKDYFHERKRLKRKKNRNFYNRSDEINFQHFPVS